MAVRRRADHWIAAVAVSVAVSVAVVVVPANPIVRTRRVDF